MRRYTPFLVGLLFFVPALACGAPTPTPKTGGVVPSTAPNTATATTRPPTAVPPASPTPTQPRAVPITPTVAAASAATVGFRSGGFGKTRSEWETVYQKPEKEMLGLFTYANGNYLVMYADGRVSYLEHIWGDKDAKTREFAEGASKPFLPGDAKLVQEYKNPRSGNTVVLYHSEGLAGLFSPASFIGGSPGDFTVIFRDVTGKVTSFLIALGNAP